MEDHAEWELGSKEWETTGMRTYELLGSDQEKWLCRSGNCSWKSKWKIEGRNTWGCSIFPQLWFMTNWLWWLSIYYSIHWILCNYTEVMTGDENWGCDKGQTDLFWTNNKDQLLLTWLFPVSWEMPAMREHLQSSEYWLHGQVTAFPFRVHT